MVTVRDGRFRADVAARGELPRAGYFLLACLFSFIPTTAFAAQTPSSEDAVVVFVAELGLLLLVGRAMGEIAQRIGQPAVMGPLIGGPLLGPSVLGVLLPQAQ